jgi:hypothetical protein
VPASASPQMAMLIELETPIIECRFMKKLNFQQKMSEDLHQTIKVQGFFETKK